MIVKRVLRVYPDTNFFIYLLERHPIFSPAVDLMYEQLKRPGYLLCSSLLIRSEMRVMPGRLNQEFRIASMKMLFRSNSIALLPFDYEASERYVRLRATERVKSLDALHLATAAAAGVDLFITNDTRLHALTVPGIGRIVGLDYPLPA